MKKPVSIRAVTARINRKLSKEGKKLVKNSPKWRSEYGEYSVIDLSTNVISASRVEFETLAREHGAIAEYEVIEHEA